MQDVKRLSAPRKFGFLCNPPWQQKSPTPWTSSPSLPARPISDGSIDPDGGGRRWIGTPTPPTRKTTARCNDCPWTPPPNPAPLRNAEREILKDFHVLDKTRRATTTCLSYNIANGPNRVGGNAYAWKRNARRPPTSNWTASPFPIGVSSGRLSMPTATTPAMDDNASSGTMAGGLSAVPPLHYRKEAMMQDDTGRLLIPFCKVKEQLHDIPVDCSPSSFWLHSTPELRPTPTPRRPDRPSIGAGFTFWAWTRRRTGGPRIAHPPQLEPAKEALIMVRLRWRHDLTRIWRDVIREIRQIVEDWEDRTTAWLSERSFSVRRWRDRDNGRYQNPISLERPRAANLDYVRRRTSGGRVHHIPTSCWPSSLRRHALDASSGQPEHPPCGQYGRGQSRRGRHGHPGGTPSGRRLRGHVLRHPPRTRTARSKSAGGKIGDARHTTPLFGHGTSQPTT